MVFCITKVLYKEKTRKQFEANYYGQFSGVIVGHANIWFGFRFEKSDATH